MNILSSIILSLVTASAFLLGGGSASAWELTNWQKKSKEIALDWHTKTIEGIPFGWGDPGHKAEFMAPYYQPENAANGKHNEAAVGNMLPNELKKLLAGRTTITTKTDNWRNTPLPNSIQVMHYAKNGQRYVCGFSFLPGGKIKTNFVEEDHWDVQGPASEPGGSEIMLLAPEELNKPVRGTKHGVTAFYDRDMGHFGWSYWMGNFGFYKERGVVQDGIPQFAYDACPSLQRHKNLKVNADQTVYEFDKIIDRKHNKYLARNKAKTLFEQKIEGTLTLKHLYFDITQAQMNEWALKSK